ncbi:hypothetical protein VNO80_21825 [Phaseolus coccineus]|uniref:Uncharacterized protein n=1 Tax=Phaseolus coccineus TaxID=3886 RepID=A0AAN9M331_PHACN
MQVNSDMTLNRCNDKREAAEIKTTVNVDEEDPESKKPYGSGRDDVVSGKCFWHLELQQRYQNRRTAVNKFYTGSYNHNKQIRLLVSHWQNVHYPNQKISYYLQC